MLLNNLKYLERLSFSATVGESEKLKVDDGALNLAWSTIK